MFHGSMKTLAVALAVFALPALRANAQDDAAAPADHAHHALDASQVPNEAIAVLHPTKGNDVQGYVRLSQQGDAVEVTAKVTGLTPGKHGFHVHEFGDLTKADGTSAGGHFNPTGAAHGGPEDEERHMGDFGNLEAGEDGTATYKMSFPGATLHLLFGRAIVVHAGEDDLMSQPSGNAGDRVAVGVIGVASTSKMAAAAHSTTEEPAAEEPDSEESAEEEADAEEEAAAESAAP